MCVQQCDRRLRCAGMGIKLGTRSTRLYGLNLSRCLGDKFLKDGDLGLSAAPHVSHVVRLPPRAAGLVVLASDGLWDVANAARAVAVRLSSALYTTYQAVAARLPTVHDGCASALQCSSPWGVDYPVDRLSGPLS